MRRAAPRFALAQIDSGIPAYRRLLEEEWLGLVEARRATGVAHLCMRTLGGDLDAKGHLDLLRHVRKRLDDA